jgi:hypothetical protein
MSFLETREGRRAASWTAPEAHDFMRDNPDGWRVVSGKDGGWIDRCGLVAHRGVLHPDEYVSMARLVPAVERRLGFTADELRWVYQGRGRRTAAQRMLRARIDARLLRLAEAGGNLELLAQVTGIDRKTIGRALTRAKVARGDRRGHPGGSRMAGYKQALARRDGGARCRYCGLRQKLRDMTVDHVVPLSRGGNNALSNLVLACAACNRAKSAHPVDAVASGG